MACPYQVARDRPPHPAQTDDGNLAHRTTSKNEPSKTDPLWRGSMSVSNWLSWFKRRFMVVRKVVTVEARQLFRLDNEVLAFRFTATMSDRASATPRERLSDHGRLKLWLHAAGFGVPDVSPAEFQDALDLREAIYRAGLAVAVTQRPDPGDAAILNGAAAAGQPRLALESGLAVWHLSEEAPVPDALSVLAVNAIQVLGG